MPHARQPEKCSSFRNLQKMKHAVSTGGALNRETGFSKSKTCLCFLLDFQFFLQFKCPAGGDEHGSDRVTLFKWHQKIDSMLSNSNKAIMDAAFDKGVSYEKSDTSSSLRKSIFLSCRMAHCFLSTLVVVVALSVLFQSWYKTDVRDCCFVCFDELVSPILSSSPCKSKL